MGCASQQLSAIAAILGEFFGHTARKAPQLRRPPPGRWNINRFCGLQGLEICKMDNRDKELLDKQLRRLGIAPAWSENAALLVLVAVFLAGMTVGSYLFAHQSSPTILASSDAAATSQANIALPIAR
jgi:hypothetical protein